jgi:hypothetical protein
MTAGWTNDIMGHERDRERQFPGRFRSSFSRIFSGEIATFGVEKSVEISLKSVSILLAKRSKKGSFEMRRCSAKIALHQRSLTVMQSFRSMNGPVVPA